MREIFRYHLHQVPGDTHGPDNRVHKNICVKIITSYTHEQTADNPI